MKIKDISDITVGMGCLSGRIAIQWVSGGKRYHFWVKNIDTLSDEGIMYCNPPLGLTQGEGYFYTRRMETDNKANKDAVEFVKQQVRDLGLVAVEEQRLLTEIIEAKAAEAEAARIHRIQVAGPALLQALERLTDALYADDHHVNLGRYIGRLYDESRNAITQAKGE